MPRFQNETNRCCIANWKKLMVLEARNAAGGRLLFSIMPGVLCRELRWKYCGGSHTNPDSYWVVSKRASCTCPASLLTSRTRVSVLSHPRERETDAASVQYLHRSHRISQLGTSPISEPSGTVRTTRSLQRVRTNRRSNKVLKHHTRVHSIAVLSITITITITTILKNHDKPPHQYSSNRNDANPPTPRRRPPL